MDIWLMISQTITALATIGLAVIAYRYTKATFAMAEGTNLMAEATNRMAEAAENQREDLIKQADHDKIVRAIMVLGELRHLVAVARQAMPRYTDASPLSPTIPPIQAVIWQLAALAYESFRRFSPTHELLRALQYESGITEHGRKLLSALEEIDRIACEELIKLTPLPAEPS